MKVELEVEEVQELMALIADRISEEAGLADEDGARVKRWRGESMRPGSEGMRELTEKVNADLERALRTKEKSAVMKPDWR
jgi:hypothetical protein